MIAAAAPEPVLCDYCTRPGARTIDLVASPCTPIRLSEIAGYQGYRIRTDGTVWSCWNSRWGMTDSWRRLKPLPVKDGYLTVVLYADELKRRRYLHHLVLESFVGPRPDGLEGCHWDSDKTNNRLCNLRWDSVSGNRADSIRIGTFARGEKMPHAKLSPEIVRDARSEYAKGTSAYSLAKKHRVDLNTMLAALRKKTWAHVGERP